MSITAINGHITKCSPDRTLAQFTVQNCCVKSKTTRGIILIYSQGMVEAIVKYISFGIG